MNSRSFKWILRLCLASTIIWSLIVMPIGIYQFSQKQGDPTMLDLKPGWSGEKVTGYIQSLQPDAKPELFKMYTIYDRIYPILYGSFFIIALIYYRKGFNNYHKWVAFIFPWPILMVAADYIENQCILQLLGENPDPLIADNLGMITAIKWITGIIAVIILVIGIYGYRKKKQHFIAGNSTTTKG